MSPTARKASSQSFKFFLALTLLFSALAGVAQAQDATSTAAAARTRYLAEAGVLPSSREVAVEEFINYHRHQIGRPKAGEAVALDMRWGNDQMSGNGREAVLQIGFSTALANDRRQLRPLNLALVIDKSGSMADLDKLTRVKAALLTFINQLRESDVLSIVIFDSQAQVLMPAQPLRDKEYVRQLVRGLAPGSSTNIHAGLMLGYQEALKNYRREATNRVILLTDGIANQGVTDPGRIAQESLSFNDRGIDLTTIGVGLDLNKDLLRALAKSGRGLFHFVADTEDITKVFIKEAQSLVSPVANEPNLEIEYDSNLALAQLYGYEPQADRNRVRIKLDNMNSGMTQVVLLRFKLARQPPYHWRMPVRARLTYYDLEQNRQIVKTESAFLTWKDGQTSNMLRDEEVGKNYTIALLAQAIRDMAAASEAHRYREAESLLTEAIAKSYQRYPTMEDEDVVRTLTIAEKYREVLRKYNREQGAKHNM